MIPADMRGGSAMVPAAPYQCHTGAMCSKMGPMPQNLPASVPTAVPGAVGTPVLVAQVPAVPAVSGTVPRTTSPDRRQYF